MEALHFIASLPNPNLTYQDLAFCVGALIRIVTRTYEKSHGIRPSAWRPWGIEFMLFLTALSLGFMVCPKARNLLAHL